MIHKNHNPTIRIIEQIYQCNNMDKFTNYVFTCHEKWAKNRKKNLGTEIKIRANTQHTHSKRAPSQKDTDKRNQIESKRERERQIKKKKKKKKM